jgi:hypothetical protein
MRIAVIGDYESPEYQDLLMRVQIVFPGETVLDLSRHGSVFWKKSKDERLKDIELAQIIIICADWDRLTDAKIDITRAQSLRKECFIDITGKFLPFPEFAKRW